MKNDNAITPIANAVAAIKQAILSSQHRVAQIANRELLSLYFGIGKYISIHTRNNTWGTGAIDSISKQLQRDLPGLRGFSAASLKKMRIFYEQWRMIENRSLTVNDLENKNDSVNIQALTNRSLLVNDLDIHEFQSLSFTHHYELLAKIDNLDERIFYIKKAAENCWSKDKLIDEIKADLYHNQSALVNNFTQSMPLKVSALKAISMFKDNYLLDFVNMEELNARDKDIDERILEQQIIHNIKNFIITFGHDFSYVGNQYHLEKFGVEQFPDLLFYNRELMALVVVELKMGEFKPAYLGQLSAYLRILDSEVKKPHENPSIGIVLCKKANKPFVEFLIQGYDNPMGVATYRTADEVRKLLPSEDELCKLINHTDTE